MKSAEFVQQVYRLLRAGEATLKTGRPSPECHLGMDIVITGPTGLYVRWLVAENRESFVVWVRSPDMRNPVNGDFIPGMGWIKMALDRKEFAKMVTARVREMGGRVRAHANYVWLAFARHGLPPAMVVQTPLLATFQKVEDMLPTTPTKRLKK